jgi:hypothetical protein
MVCILKAFVAQAQDTPAAACTDVHKLVLREWKTPAWHGRMVAARWRSQLAACCDNIYSDFGSCDGSESTCGAFTGAGCIIVMSD